MPQKPQTFENYPTWIVLVTNLASLSTYAAGAYILLQLSVVWAALYVLYLLYLELSLYKDGCTCCYYYGKLCAFGRGKVVPLLFRKEDPEKFCKREVNWKKMIPQMLATFVPMAVGVVLLVRDFDWIILGMMLWPVVLWIVGNPIVYGKLACAHCKQGEICCPASEFFKPKKK